MTFRQRIAPFLHITLAAILNMALYLLLSTVWRAILNDTESSAVQLFLYNLAVPLMTCAGYGLCLCFLTYMRRDRGEDKVLADYRDRAYLSLRDDLRVTLRRERVYLVLIGAVIAACTLLRGLDHLILGEGEKLFTHVTFPYMTMDLFANSFSVTLLGECVSAVADVFFYLLSVLLYRRRAWRRWNGKHETGGRA